MEDLHKSIESPYMVIASQTAKAQICKKTKYHGTTDTLRVHAFWQYYRYESPCVKYIYDPEVGDYLSWAFTEAAQMARRFNAGFGRYYNRKAAQTNTIVARRALSNKLARVCYYIMRDQVAFTDELILH